MESSPQSSPENISGPFAISSSRVVTPQGEIPASIVIENGKIIRINQGDEALTGMDCVSHGDLVISPGLVDAHVHINEPGTDWEGFESATKSAAAGGVTTLIDMPLNSLPVTTDIEALKLKIESAQGKLYVDVGFHGGVVPDNGNQIPWLLDQGVLGVKAFLCNSGLEQFPAVGERELRAALADIKTKGVPLLAHAEIEFEVANLEIDSRTSYRRYINSRPPEFELAAIKLLINLCREYQTPVHIVHLATAEALPLIEAAKQEGLLLTVETCPHYLFFDATNVTAGDTRFKCAPPIRDEANRIALCDAVTSGLIDTIGSDHSPCPPKLKELESGDFTKAWGGIAGLQLSLPASWTALKDRGLSLFELTQRTATRPADLFGLSDRKGKIEVGYDADLVVWNPTEIFSVNSQDLFHRYNVTPYENSSLHGVVERTLVRGNVVYDKAAQPHHYPPSGLPLIRINARPDFVATYLDNLSESALSKVLENCCAATAWVESMMHGGKFAYNAAVVTRAEKAATNLSESDWLQAFKAHPRIGDIDSLMDKYANTRDLAGDEQSGVDVSDDVTLKRLVEANELYYKKFGFIFIVFATGKSAAQMLGILERRLLNDRANEIAIAAAEQLKITLLRLRKLTP